MQARARQTKREQRVDRWLVDDDRDGRERVSTSRRGRHDTADPRPYCRHSRNQEDCETSHCWPPIRGESGGIVPFAETALTSSTCRLLPPASAAQTRPWIPLGRDCGG